MSEDIADSALDPSSTEGLGPDVSVPVSPLVGLTQYNGELHLRDCRDGVELTLDIPAGPIDMTLTDADAQAIVDALSDD